MKLFEEESQLEKAKRLGEIAEHSLKAKNYKQALQQAIQAKELLGNVKQNDCQT